MEDQEQQIAELLEGRAPEVHALVHQLRQLVQATVPAATEKVYRRWQGIGYTHPTAGYFCAIFPQQGHVNLSFEYGVLLPDPAGLLKGTGTQMRYIEIHQPDDIRPEEIQRLLLAALGLPKGREAKLQLIQARPLSS